MSGKFGPGTRSRRLYNDLMQEEDVQEIAVKTIALASSLLQEAEQEERVFAKAENNLEKKKVISLYSRMGKNIRRFVGKYQEYAAQEADTAKEEADNARRRLDHMLRQLQELEQMAAKLKEENSDLLSKENDLKQMEEQLEEITQEQTRLEEEWKQAAGEDGNTPEHIFARAGEVEREAHKQHEKNNNLQAVSEFANRITLDEQAGKLASNMEECWETGKQAVEAADTQVLEMFTQLRNQIAEKIQEYQAEAQEAVELERRLGLLQKLVGRDSKLMKELEKAGISDIQELEQVVAEYRRGMKDELHQYDEILAEAAAEGERRRKQIERMQNKK